MSRSYKKNPVYTDGKRRTTKETKQKANRCVRRYNKQIVNGYFMRDPRYLDILTLDGKSYTRFFPSWDIHDYVSWWSKAEAVNTYEHPHWIYDGFRNEWWHTYDQFEDLDEFLNFWEKYQRRK